MTAIVFDTLKFAKRLEQAGIPTEHAEAISEAFRDATGEELVTREYLDLRVAELRTLISSQTADIVKWVGGLLLAQAGLVTALVKLLG